MREMPHHNTHGISLYICTMWSASILLCNSKRIPYKNLKKKTEDVVYGSLYIQDTTRKPRPEKQKNY